VLSRCELSGNAAHTVQAAVLVPNASRVGAHLTEHTVLVREKSFVPFGSQRAAIQPRRLLDSARVVAVFAPRTAQIEVAARTREIGLWPLRHLPQLQPDRLDRKSRQFRVQL
jgi:hypothetical protein